MIVVAEFLAADGNEIFNRAERTAEMLREQLVCREATNTQRDKLNVFTRIVNNAIAVPLGERAATILEVAENGSDCFHDAATSRLRCSHEQSV